MSPVVAQRSRPCAGESVNGDVALVRRWDDVTLLAVIDALGHGQEAAESATAAARYIEGVSRVGSVTSVLEGLGDTLRSMRGAAGLLCLLRGRRVEAAGVGNVEMRVLGSRFRAVGTPGILGGRSTRLRVFDGELAPGTRLILYSDGVSGLFPDEMALGGAPDAVCATLLAEFGRARDDATVLVADIP